MAIVCGVRTYNITCVCVCVSDGVAGLPTQSEEPRLLTMLLAHMHAFGLARTPHLVACNRT